MILVASRYASLKRFRHREDYDRNENKNREFVKPAEPDVCTIPRIDSKFLDHTATIKMVTNQKRY